MNKERLLTLAHALENRIPKERFHLGGWRMQDLDYFDTAVDAMEEFELHGHTMAECGNIEDDLLLHDCGTAGCAVGWACALPEFKEEGLHFTTTPCFKGSENWPAVGHFFDINYSDAKFLFQQDNYTKGEEINPLAVAARIREFINQQENDHAHD